MIRVKNLTKFYGDFQALRDVSFDIKRGEIIGLLGPNGAGKTTTMKILTGYLSFSSGQVVIDSDDVLDAPIEIRRKIGYLPENNPLYMDMNVWEYLEYSGAMHGLEGGKLMKSISRVIAECSLEEKVYAEISELSKGYRQRVGLAQALIHDPEILILDEPTSGLDPNQILEIRQLIKKIGEKKTVILSSHILSEVEVTCNRVLIMNKGAIVASGTPAELHDSMSGKVKMYITIEGKHHTKALKMLQEIENIDQVELISAHDDGTTSFKVQFAKEYDLRKKILHTLLEHNFELVELRREQVSLENIFLELTK